MDKKLPVWAEPPGVWIFEIVVGFRSLRLSSQRNDWGLAAGVNVDDTGDEGNFCERFVFYLLKKWRKNILVVMAFDENLLDDLTFEHVDKGYNEEMNLKIMDQFLHVKGLWQSKEE